MKTSGELIWFIDKRVKVRLEDGREGYGVLRLWQMQGPREYPYVLDPAGPEETGWVKNRRFFAREVVDIHLAT
jgi:hypothetical protein